MKIPQKKSNKKKLVVWLIVIFFVLLLTAGVFAYLELAKSRNANDQKSTEASKQANLKAAKSTTPNQTSAKSDDSKSTGGSTTNPTNGKTTVPVTVIDAAQYQSNIQVRAYASDISTNSVCTFTFSKSGYADITKQTSGNVNASTTSCSELTIPASSFPATGSWTLTVTYSSNDAQGSSNSQSVEVH